MHRFRKSRTWLALAAASIGMLLETVCCTTLEQKEREIVFRIEPVEDGTHNDSLRLGARDMRSAFGDAFALRVPAS